MSLSDGRIREIPIDPQEAPRAVAGERAPGKGLCSHSTTMARGYVQATTRRAVKKSGPERFDGGPVEAGRSRRTAKAEASGGGEPAGLFLRLARRDARPGASRSRAKVVGRRRAPEPLSRCRPFSGPRTRSAITRYDRVSDRFLFARPSERRRRTPRRNAPSRSDGASDWALGSARRASLVLDRRDARSLLRGAEAM